MANRGFNSVFVLIGVCICTQLDVVLLQNPSDGSANWPGYYKETDNADFAISMTLYESHQLSVYFFYDTETKSAKDFFTMQLPGALLDGLYPCRDAVYLEFYTCSTSQLKNEKLFCSQGEKQCTDNEYQICVVNVLQDKTNLTGKFLSCYFSGKPSDKCAEENQMSSKDLQECAAGKTDINVTKTCDDFHTAFEKIRKTNQPAKDNAKQGKYPDAFTNFKGALCQVLKDCALKCPAVCG